MHTALNAGFAVLAAAALLAGCTHGDMTDADADADADVASCPYVSGPLTNVEAMRVTLCQPDLPGSAVLVHVRSEIFVDSLGRCDTWQLGLFEPLTRMPWSGLVTGTGSDLAPVLPPLGL